ncbi:hypothetical protein TNIN_496151 [Trichonephila inaurata madagascariensis]|uniref:Uncharacterized protein n=1 Tax=Trichonephila inaurata madagascariensis TaxID=2747483 RepID=A0A8X6XSH0_9ARAC|nr:hypothetical protein TNIN_496151 [Trichonephila inaurata madagascariensis]
MTCFDDCWHQARDQLTGSRTSMVLFLVAMRNEKGQGLLSQKEIRANTSVRLYFDDDSASSNNSDTDDEDYVESVATGENISLDNEEIDEI